MSNIRGLATKIRQWIDPAAFSLALAAGLFQVEKNDVVASALIAAAVTRLVDVSAERRRERAAETDRRAKDLDETRRLLYMILALPTAPRHGDLVATAANALAHHGRGIPVDESLPRLTVVANGGGDIEHDQWIRARIVEITKRLEDQATRTG